MNIKKSQMFTLRDVIQKPSDRDLSGVIRRGLMVLILAIFLEFFAPASSPSYAENGPDYPEPTADLLVD